VEFRSSFNPLHLLTDPITASKPDLTCSDNSPNIIVNENAKFNLSLIIVDKQSQNKISNIGWNVN
jgi:hypothetical protein